jgi:hypothetical protein
MITIRDWRGNVLREVDAETLKGADLGGAYLRDANLGGADLGGAYLRDANLGGADLGDANLGGADLGGADLGGADLRDANLGGANLRGAYLRDADLRGADLGGADLRGANLGGANLRGADLGGADLGGADLPMVPSIDHIDAAILAAIEAPGNALAMESWHRDGPCGTTHCRAGWAIQLAGYAGYMLEDWVGPAVAGALIYAASGSHPVPDFSATDEDALADLRARAEQATTPDTALATG